MRTFPTFVFTILLLLALTPMCGSQESAQPAANTPVASSAGPTMQERDPRYQLTASDVFDLDFRFQPEFNQTLTVQPDGFVTLRDVGDLHVAGLTVPQLSALLDKKYSTILNSPVITVVLKDFQKPRILVGGEVNRPGAFDLRSDVTAAEAVQLAGGFTTAAKHSEVLLFRKTMNEWMEVKKLDVKSMLKKGDLHEDVHLRPGDMLFVPKNKLSKVSGFLPRASVGALFNPLHF